MLLNTLGIDPRSYLQNDATDSAKAAKVDEPGPKLSQLSQLSQPPTPRVLHSTPDPHERILAGYARLLQGARDVLQVH